MKTVLNMRRGNVSVDFVLRFGSRILNSLAQAALLVFLARQIDPTTFGVFLVCYSVGLFGTNLLGFGLSTTSLVMLSEHPAVERRSYISSFILIRLAAGTVVSGFVYLYSSVNYPGLVFWALAGAMLAYAESVLEIVQSVLAGLGRQLSCSLLIGSAKVLLLGSVIFLVVVLDQSVLLSVFLGLSATTVLPLILVAGDFGRPRLSRALVRTTSGFWAANLSGNIRQLEPALVSMSWSTALAGGYAFASKFSNPLLIFVSSLQSIFLPRLSRSYVNESGFVRLERQLFILLALYGAAIILLSPVGATLVIGLLGQEYESNRMLLISVFAATGLASLTGAIQIGAYAMQMPWIVTASVGITSSLGILFLLATSALDSGASEWVLVAYPVSIQVLMLALSLVLYFVGRKARFRRR